MPKSRRPALDWSAGELATLGKLAAMWEADLKADPEKWPARKDGLVAGLKLALIAFRHVGGKESEFSEILTNLQNAAFNHAGMASLDRRL